jgi:hypothetical protein
MQHYVGFDVGKDAHWACVLDAQGEVILSRKGRVHLPGPPLCRRMGSYCGHVTAARFSS